MKYINEFNFFKKKPKRQINTDILYKEVTYDEAILFDEGKESEKFLKTELNEIISIFKKHKHTSDNDTSYIFTIKLNQGNRIVIIKKDDEWFIVKESKPKNKIEPGSRKLNEITNVKYYLCDTIDGVLQILIKNYN